MYFHILVGKENTLFVTEKNTYFCWIYMSVSLGSFTSVIIKAPNATLPMWWRIKRLIDLPTVQLRLFLSLKVTKCSQHWTIGTNATPRTSLKAPGKRLKRLPGEVPSRYCSWYNHLLTSQDKLRCPDQTNQMIPPHIPVDIKYLWLRVS